MVVMTMWLAPIGLQPARHDRPRLRRRARGAGNRDDRDEGARQDRFEREAGERDAEAPQHRLPLGPDIEQPRLEGERAAARPVKMKLVA